MQILLDSIQPHLAIEERNQKQVLIKAKADNSYFIVLKQITVILFKCGTLALTFKKLSFVFFIKPLGASHHLVSSLILIELLCFVLILVKAIFICCK